MSSPFPLKPGIACDLTAVTSQSGPSCDLTAVTSQSGAWCDLTAATLRPRVVDKRGLCDLALYFGQRSALSADLQKTISFA